MLKFSAFNKIHHIPIRPRKLQEKIGRAFVLCIFLTGLTSPLDSLARQSKPYRGAEYRTKASYKYGRFEVRMKSSSGSGMLTSFFTFHDQSGFTLADWNEVDIEILGRYQNEMQINTITPGQVNHEHRNPLQYNPHISFHVYAFEWTPDYVAWFVDGFEALRQTGEHIATLNRPQKIMMNIWQPIWINWAGAFNPDNLPIHGFYDWIKYYAYTPGEGDNFTLQWTEELSEWDHSRWDKATHTWDGNNSLFTHDNAVFKDGYLILCLTKPEATGYNGGIIVDLDVDAPYLVWARAEGNRVHVSFSETITQETAEIASNYIIPGVQIQSASLLPGNTTVELVADSLSSEQSHLLVVTNIRDRSNSAHKMPLQQMTISNGLSFPAKINVGGAMDGDFLDDLIWDFYQEYGAVGGAAASTPPGVVSSIGGDEVIYETALNGLTFYQIRVPSGTFDITLMLAEKENQNSGERVFDVIAEGRVAIDNLDIFAEAGKNTALEKTIANLPVTDGVLDLYFKPEIGAPTLSGLKIVQRTVTAVKEEPGAAVPDHFDLRIFPNPFNPSAKIVVALETAHNIELSLFDMSGRFVRRIEKGFFEAGAYTILLNATGLGAGIYFIALYIDGRLAKTRKAIHIK